MIQKTLLEVQLRPCSGPMISFYVYIESFQVIKKANLCKLPAVYTAECSLLIDRKSEILFSGYYWNKLQWNTMMTRENILWQDIQQTKWGFSARTYKSTWQKKKNKYAYRLVSLLLYRYSIKSKSKWKYPRGNELKRYVVHNLLSAYWW